MKTSDALKNFRFERGEHTVILRPDLYEGQRDIALWQLARQIASELAWFNPGRVMLLTSVGDFVSSDGGYMTSVLASALGIDPYDRRTDTTMKRAAIAQRLDNKLARTFYESSKEEVRGGLEANLEHIISHAGDITAIVVDHVERIAQAGGEVEKISTPGNLPDEEVVTTKQHPNARWQHRYAEILSYLGKVAKEKNICVVSCAKPMLPVGEFNRVTSLGLRGVWHWNDGPCHAVDQLYGIQYATLPLADHLEIKHWQKLVSYNVSTKEVTKTDIFDNTTYGDGFVCHEMQKVLDNLMAN